MANYEGIPNHRNPFFARFDIEVWNTSIERMRARQHSPGALINWTYIWLNAMNDQLKLRRINSKTFLNDPLDLKIALVSMLYDGELTEQADEFIDKLQVSQFGRLYRLRRKPTIVSLPLGHCTKVCQEPIPVSPDPVKYANFAEPCDEIWNAEKLFTILTHAHAAIEAGKANHYLRPSEGLVL